MKIGLFAGTFDPPTLGHEEIIRRASFLGDKLYVAVAESKDKHTLLLAVEERLSILKELAKEWEHVEIISLQGLAVDCALKYQADFLVRGLRTPQDLNFEMQMASANRQMTGIETICLIASPQYCHISSSLVRTIAAHGKSIKEFVSSKVASRIDILHN